MSAYDLEEQEQIAKLRAFWKDYGGLILAAIIAVLLAITALNLWRWYQASQSQRGGALYGELTKAAAAREPKKVADLASTIIETHPRSLYAALAALVNAKLQFDAGDLKAARVSLQWVVDKADDPDLRSLARLRLAAVLIDDKSYDEALKVLDAKPEPAFEGQFAEARGDVLVAQGKRAEARAAYTAALAKVAAADAAGRELIQLKLDSLGDS